MRFLSAHLTIVSPHPDIAHRMVTRIDDEQKSTVSAISGPELAASGQLRYEVCDLRRHWHQSGCAIAAGYAQGDIRRLICMRRYL